MPFRRSMMLSMLLSVAIVLVGVRIYRIWAEPLIAPPNRAEQSAALNATMKRGRAFKPRPMSITSIVKKNLFDPNRGSGTADATGASPVSGSKVQKFVLLGTMITPDERRAIIRVPEDLDETGKLGKTLRTAKRSSRKVKVRRVNLGDQLGGFELADIEPGKVTFIKGADRFELVLDFTRKREIRKAPPSPTKKPKKTTRRTPRRRANRG